MEDTPAFNKDELFEAHRSLLSTLEKCEKVLESEKLPQSQRTLTERRVAALKIALTLIEREASEPKILSGETELALND